MREFLEGAVGDVNNGRLVETVKWLLNASLILDCPACDILRIHASSQARPRPIIYHAESPYLSRTYYREHRISVPKDPTNH